MQVAHYGLIKNIQKVHILTFLIKFQLLMAKFDIILMFIFF